MSVEWEKSDWIAAIDRILELMEVWKVRCVYHFAFALWGGRGHP